MNPGATRPRLGGTRRAATTDMVDWIGIVSACGLAAVVGVGFVLWERYEAGRLARCRLQRRVLRRRGRVVVAVDSERRAA
jgi:hypothetical protein